MADLTVTTLPRDNDDLDGDDDGPGGGSRVSGDFFFAIFIFLDGQFKHHLHGKMIIFTGFW
jgi:hypothetical protein